jgi:hypothetical protein
LQPPLKQRAHNPNAALINEVRIEACHQSRVPQ